MDPEAHFKPLNWIESTGGPLLLIEKTLLAHWHGSFGDGAAMTDYDRACEIADYVGALEVGPGFGVVFGEEPFSTTWLPSQELLNSFIVRWVYAEDETKVREVLRSLSIADQWQATDVKLEIFNDELILFDSSCSGADVDSSLAIEISPGSYAIQTLHYNPNDEVSLILHRFVA
ncbi:MAG TPA: Imm21 family immunity protein [Pyrinomonadaceae bacterium]|nr:Imm21 family immunity protein [Pyrinomonadaceae bacterium]